MGDGLVIPADSGLVRRYLCRFSCGAPPLRADQTTPVRMI